MQEVDQHGQDSQFTTPVNNQEWCAAHAWAVTTEADLEQAIINTWGEYGAHANLYRTILRRLALAEDDSRRLRDALRQAREDLESWGAYASDYFKEKWDLAGDLARIDAELGRDSR